MRTGQNRIVLACLAIAESASAYAVLALLGSAAGQGASPMTMLAILAVLASGIAVSRALLYVAMPDWSAFTIQAALGVIVIWLTVATQVSAEGMDLGWPASGLGAGDLAEGYAFRAIAGGLTAVYLWRRGSHLAGLQAPVHSLSLSFRIGIVIMTIAAVVDAIIEPDLNIYSVMFVFLAASLAGLGVGRLLPSSPETEHARILPRVIGGVVTGVVLTGLFIGLVQNTFLSQLSRLAITGLGFMIDRVVKYVLLAIIYPLAYLVGLIVEGIIRLLNIGERPIPVPGEQQQAPVDTFLEDLRERVSEPDPDRSFILFDVLEYVLIAVVLLAVAYLLVRAFRRRLRTRVIYEAGDRESVSEGRSPMHDAANLLLGLLPRGFGRRRFGGYRLPDGPPAVVDVFRMYYGLLNLARRRGVERAPHETTGEFRGRMASVLPRGLVSRATAAFERACYGGRPTPSPAIAEMRAALEAEERGESADARSSERGS